VIRDDDDDDDISQFLVSAAGYVHTHTFTRKFPFERCHRQNLQDCNVFRVGHARLEYFITDMISCLRRSSLYDT